MFMLSSRRSPRVVELETLVAKVGLAVSAALGSLQRLGRLTETAHDGYAAQTYCVPVPLHNALQGEVTKAVCQAFLPELYILLTGRTGKQHGGMGLLPPSPWVCPTHWESDAGVGIKRKETQTQKNKKQGF